MKDGISAVAQVASRRSRVRPGPVGGPGEGVPVPLEWRILDDGPLEGALNMALDEALAREVPEGRAVLRLYGWSCPTVSFGRNEPALDEYSTELARDMGLACVRRPTGGRAVLHDEELTYSVVMPIRAAGGVRAAYRRINVALTRALGSLGAAVEMSEADSTAPLDAGPCFGVPARGEVVASGRKLVGSAQARVGTSLLQHGSVLLAGDQSRLDGIRRSPVGTDVVAPTSLSQLVGPVMDSVLRSEVAQAMQREFGGSWSRGEYSEAEQARAESLVASRYRDEAWTWRR